MSGPTKDELRASTKVCTLCREEKTGTDYTIFRATSGKLRLMTRCKRCRAAKEVEHRRNDPAYANYGREYARKNNSRRRPYVMPEADLARAREYARDYRRREQAKSLEGASNYYKAWTGPELELILRRDLTAPQAAEMLGRTVAAVRRMRVKAQRDDMSGATK